MRACSRAKVLRSLYSTSTFCSSASISACISLRRLAKPKKSSARRKKPRRVRFVQESLKYFANSRAWIRLGSRLVLSLPTTIISAAQANASSRVDLPVPFSPTNRVTGESNLSPCSVCRSGREKGKACEAGRGRRLTWVRWSIYITSCHCERPTATTRSQAAKQSLRNERDCFAVGTRRVPTGARNDKFTFSSLQLSGS